VPDDGDNSSFFLGLVAGGGFVSPESKRHSILSTLGREEVRLVPISRRAPAAANFSEGEALFTYFIEG
jgi:hypothetical protein